MAYVTNTDIEERLGTALYVGLTDDGGTGQPDLDKIVEARDGAEGEANSYLGRQYAAPVDLSAYPELAAVLKSFVLDLIEFRLHGRRPPVPGVVFQKRQEAVGWLKKVADGQVVLPAAKVVTESGVRGQTAATSGRPRVFTRDELADL